MRGMIWVVAAAIGALSGGATATLFPNTQLIHATRAFGVDLSGFTIADLNPIRAAYDTVQAKIQSGVTPEELGFHPSAVSATLPDPKNWPGVGLTLSPGMQNGWASTVTAQMRENSNRMQDLANYARNPAAWRGMPPH
jgi:hypothetical protein